MPGFRSTELAPFGHRAFRASPTGLSSRSMRASFPLHNVGTVETELDRRPKWGACQSDRVRAHQQRHHRHTATSSAYSDIMGMKDLAVEEELISPSCACAVGLAHRLIERERESRGCKHVLSAGLYADRSFNPDLRSPEGKPCCWQTSRKSIPSSDVSH